jgi:shikimate dehydrogenase
MCGAFLDSLEISARTGIYGILGDPVDHSLSPAIHNCAFRKVGVDALYVAFQVKKSDLRSAVHGTVALGIRGFNVTVPHKIAITKYLEQLDEVAAAVGSVNTVLNLDGVLKGFNTDVAGAIETIKTKRLKGASILIIGAGGAGRAIAHAFAPKAERTVILNRTVSKARALEHQLRRRYGVKVISSNICAQRRLREFVTTADIIVNASSMGMRGKNNLPIKKEWLNQSQIVFDLVYEPLNTTLLRSAKDAGAETINGVEMLLNQGANCFELWTGKKAPRMEMRREISNKIAMTYASS